jgi:hypothetical protein
MVLSGRQLVSTHYVSNKISEMQEPLTKLVADFTEVSANVLLDCTGWEVMT